MFTQQLYVPVYIFFLNRNTEIHKNFVVSQYDILRSFLVQIVVTESIGIYNIASFSKALTPEVGVEFIKIYFSILSGQK